MEWKGRGDDGLNAVEKKMHDDASAFLDSVCFD